MANKNKDKGSRAERLYAKEFRDMGFTHCKTARYGSKMLDDVGIDLILIPFNVQIKAGYEKGLNYYKTLKYTYDRMEEELPETSQEFGFPTILIHHKDKPKGQRLRGPLDSLVTMSFLDFKQLINKAYAKQE